VHDEDRVLQVPLERGLQSVEKALPIGRIETADRLYEAREALSGHF